MPIISLIIPTIHRTHEVRRLLTSIHNQTHFSKIREKVEVIIIDQNLDERLDKILAEFTDKLSIKRITVPPQGVSVAKNHGLKIASGEILAFPDDDCWFPETFFSNLLKKMEPLKNQYAGVFIRAFDPEKNQNLITYPHSCLEISLKRPRQSFLGLQIGQFYFRSAIKNIWFDPKIGPGAHTFWGGGEETDFCLNVLKSNQKILFDPTLEVFHPQVNADSMPVEKIKQYAMGFGGLCKKHGLITHCLWKVLKQSLRACGMLLLLKKRESRFSLYTAYYRLKGLTLYRSAR